ncbi:MAG TPA: hypothetical protein ENJ56_05425 [Anaerolineae bacterium]|nr:hypothetical protein [Anaerolineae bacterium]
MPTATSTLTKIATFSALPLTTPSPQTSTTLPKKSLTQVLTGDDATPTPYLTDEPTIELTTEVFSKLANNWSVGTSISGDGRFIVFMSEASNLVAGDNNGRSDIFLWDRELATTQLVTVATDGTQADDFSVNPHISADGRFVTFVSGASNLVANDTNQWDDIFVRDVQSRKTRRVSVASGGAEANHWSAEPRISADGRYIVFVSWANNLSGEVVSGLRKPHVFRHDLVSGITVQVDLNEMGEQAEGDNGGSESPSISADGRFIAFSSFATNLTTDSLLSFPNIFVRDMEDGNVIWLGSGIAPKISADANYVAFIRWIDDGLYLMLHDKIAGNTRQIAWLSTGVQGMLGNNELSLSADGQHLAYVGVMRNAATLEQKTHTDIFVYDRVSDTTQQVSVTKGGEDANAGSGKVAISADGCWIVFNSNADNLREQDTNGVSDIFLYDLKSGDVEVVSIPTQPIHEH